jgi:hypothetical protein
MLRTKWWQIVGFLVVIALGTTVVSLALQSHFGRSPMLIIVGPILATIAAAGVGRWVATRMRS